MACTHGAVHKYRLCEEDSDKSDIPACNQATDNTNECIKSDP